MLMNFLTVAMDQIVNHAAKIRFMSGGQTACPLTIRTMTGVGGGLGGQHSDMLEAWFAHVPGMKVVVPSNHADWTGLLYSSIMDDNPVLFVECTLMMRAKGIAAPPGHRLPLGKAHVARPGRDVTVVGYGRPINDALAIAGRLEGEGISVEVVDLRTVSPWDKDTVLTSAARTGRVVVVHEAVRNFGCGAEIAATIGEELFGQLKAPIRRVASKNTPVPVSPPLEKAFAWNPDEIEAAIRSTLN
jgi:pyruvate dehydrogenase E1 component beta subunit